jgi:aspartate/methionine/tyrosine aminotransferase
MKAVRRNIAHEASGRLNYEIRQIVSVAQELEKWGIGITWENIGDPVKKGEEVSGWIKEIIGRLVFENRTYGYVATEGIPETREFLAREVNRRGGCQITGDDIIFFNGLGDAIARIFGLLDSEARVIGPSPAYVALSSAESAHAGREHISYDLDPANGWMPDLEDLESKVGSDDSIAGILLINPHNPTGAVYPRDMLENVVDIARRYRLFVMCDEIYSHIVYNSAETAHLSQVIGDVPGIALRGISKEYPWPGGRCGWIEVFNRERHPDFNNYINSLISAKMLEVCSTSLPQFSIPLVMGDARYPGHLARRRDMFEKRANEAWGILSSVDGVRVVKPQGAFYLTVLFEDSVLNASQTLPIADDRIREHVEKITRDVEHDKRFAYYLLGATGICIVPLTGFCCAKKGFRVTLLEANDEKRRWTWQTIARSIQEYINSTGGTPEPAACLAHAATP